MSADSEMLPPPNNPEVFESLCLELWRDIWEDPNTQKNGRSGQPQTGVDVYGQQAGRWIGVQCKQKDGLLRSKLTVAELKREVAQALKFHPKLSTFILATTGPADAKIQKCARELTDEHSRNQLFTVSVWSWREIWQELYRRPDLLRRLGPTIWPGLWAALSKKAPSVFISYSHESPEHRTRVLAFEAFPVRPLKKPEPTLNQSWLQVKAEIHLFTSRITRRVVPAPGSGKPPITPQPPAESPPFGFGDDDLRGKWVYVDPKRISAVPNENAVIFPVVLNPDDADQRKELWVKAGFCPTWRAPTEDRRTVEEMLKKHLEDIRKEDEAAKNRERKLLQAIAEIYLFTSRITRRVIPAPGSGGPPNTPRPPSGSPPFGFGDDDLRGKWVYIDPRRISAVPNENAVLFPVVLNPDDASRRKELWVKAGFSSAFETPVPTEERKAVEEMLKKHLEDVRKEDEATKERERSADPEKKTETPRKVEDAKGRIQISKDIVAAMKTSQTEAVRSVIGSI